MMTIASLDVLFGVHFFCFAFMGTKSNMYIVSGRCWLFIALFGAATLVTLLIVSGKKWVYCCLLLFFFASVPIFLIIFSIVYFLQSGVCVSRICHKRDACKNQLYDSVSGSKHEFAMMVWELKMISGPMERGTEKIQKNVSMLTRANTFKTLHNTENRRFGALRSAQKWAEDDACNL